MFFRKSPKRRFDSRRAMPFGGQSAFDLGLEWLEARQLLTAVSLNVDGGDATCSDPNDWSLKTLPGTDHDLAINIGGTASGLAATSASSPSAGTSNVALADTGTGSVSGYAFAEPEAGSVDFNPAEPANGETPLAGVTVDLYDNLGNVVSSLVTGLDGAYSFTGLSPGTYTLGEPGAAYEYNNDLAFVGTQNGSPGSGSAGDGVIDDIAVAAGSVGAGYNLPEFNAASVLSGYVFAEQTAGSPAYSTTSPPAGESSLANIPVTLTNSVGAFVASTETNSTGFYSFANLEPEAPSYYGFFPSTAPTGVMPAMATTGAGPSIATPDTENSDTLVRGTYNITVGAVANYTSDTALVGSQGTGNAGTGSVDGISIVSGTDGTGNDFGELPVSTDLEITKTDNLGGSSVSATPGTAVPGQAITYTITVVNDGPSDVSGASVVDALPSWLTGATFTATPSGGASGFTASGSGSIDDTNLDLPVDSTITYTLQANIAPSATGTLTNTATVTPPTGVNDTNSANNSATDSDTLVPEADLEITKTDNLGGSSVTGSVGTAVPGQGIIYTITVTNDGPSDVTGASLVDDLPATLTGATFNASATGGASGFTASGSGSIDDTNVDLPVGSAITYTVQANIASSATGTLSNTAVVTPPVGVVNTNDGNSDSDITPGGNLGDAEITDGSSVATDTDSLAPKPISRSPRPTTWAGRASPGQSARLCLARELPTRSRSPTTDRAT